MASDKDRDQHILSRLANLQHKVDSIEQTTAFALRADSHRHLESVEEIFKNSKRKAQVYLASDGDRTVNEIAKHLGMKQQNVSRAAKSLQDEGLLEISETTGGAHFYVKTPLDRTIRISRYLRDKYQLDANGRAL